MTSMGLYSHMWYDAPEPIEEEEEDEMSNSVYQTVECGACGAHILTDTNGPLTADPNEHEDDCPNAAAWPDEDEDDRDAAFPELAFIPF